MRERMFSSSKLIGKRVSRIWDEKRPVMRLDTLLRIQDRTFSVDSTLFRSGQAIRWHPLFASYAIFLIQSSIVTFKNIVNTNSLFVLSFVCILNKSGHLWWHYFQDRSRHPIAMPMIVLRYPSVSLQCPDSAYRWPGNILPIINRCMNWLVFLFGACSSDNW